MDNTLHSCESAGPAPHTHTRRPSLTLTVGVALDPASCLFAQGSDMTAQEEIGNITDYLTDSFHRLDLRVELSQPVIREKQQEEVLLFVQLMSL